jgi:hypothetical protein
LGRTTPNPNRRSGFSHDSSLAHKIDLGNPMNQMTTHDGEIL